MALADALATALRHRLDEEGRTQSSLARQVGITEKHLSEMLNGHSGTLAMWDRLFDAIDCPHISLSGDGHGLWVCDECGSYRVPQDGV